MRFRAEAYAEFATEGAKFALVPRSELPGLIGIDVPSNRVLGPQAEVAFFVEDASGRFGPRFWFQI
ncbi:MAG: hypothetical protein JO321_12870 [Solirubrobacterales bacterium]|nr:hypothetical protein [Solirubrobacterales bacterium]MBV9167645.1 hypothetical protein [Solirubrobacterales bacterium]MBV9536295.1 hypothetical protein [Solirubrobacterales bacterium]